MIISEKQVSNLIMCAYQSISSLSTLESMNQLSDQGKKHLNDVCTLLNTINNQQSDELKDIGDE